MAGAHVISYRGGGAGKESIVPSAIRDAKTAVTAILRFIGGLPSSICPPLRRTMLINHFTSDLCMHPPCEMMVDSFLPAMREAVAKRLAEEGFSQGKIARPLGV